jgi:hypothetical protein
MRSTFTLSAVVGALVLVCVSTAARGQSALQPLPITHMASLAPGAILGVVQDDRGLPIPGAIVSALGTTTAVAITDKLGRFELRTLSPGAYLLRAHLSGYVASRGQMVEVHSSARSSSLIALRRSAATGTGSPTVLAAGIAPMPEPEPQPADPVGTTGSDPNAAAGDSHTELAWRLRHVRRGVLKDTDVPEEILVNDTPPDTNVFGNGSMWGYMGSPARLASSFFGSTAFSGQVNLLTTSSFDSPEQLFTTDNFSRSIAYLALGAPVGERADWTVRAALTQGDIASWIVAGEYTTRAPARHREDFGWSYSTQRYDGGNLAALSEVTDGSRNAGAVFAFDTFSITPSLTLTYGGRYAHYDYLDERSLFSPRASLTIEPLSHVRVSGVISRRAVAPGAEEFSPRMDTAIWLPPQRTFSSLDPSQPLQAERTDHVELEVERDIADATISIRAFHQRTTDQLVTVFGLDLPGTASSQLGHYFIGNAGDLEATGVSAGIRAAIAGRIHGSIEYSTTRAHAVTGEDASYLWVVAPSSVPRELDRIHDLSTSLETDVPETSTRVLVLYRISNGFARPATTGPSADRPALQSRFDVQVRQSLPFMDFSTAKWEMLVAVRNFFRDTAPDQSVYDELLVVHPPTRVVGGLTLKF